MDTIHFKKFWTLLKDVEKNTPFEYKVDNWEEELDSYCRDPDKALEALERRANVFKNFTKVNNIKSLIRSNEISFKNTINKKLICLTRFIF